MFSLFNNKLSTESYKGVRDFYPEDQYIQNYIFKTMRDVVESWGYTEYNASILEPSDLYKSKTSEEIVNDQTYTFKDRGDREVTLRPEMTPTVSRMIAGRVQELPKPIRWYSIPNLFRYEKPQKGRLREHYQLNVDLFGIKSVAVDAEVLSIANDIMSRFGASQDMYEIRINSREVMNDLYSLFGLDENKKKEISRLIDKKDKMSEGKFESSLSEIVGDKTGEIIRALNSPEYIFEKLGKDNVGAKYLQEVIETLWNRDIKNVVFKPSITRGFDYYTGIVFEFFDTNLENPRSLLGGGRYDELLKIFGKDTTPAFGFGMGDVTIKDFLSTHNLLPKVRSTCDVWLMIVDETLVEEAYKLAKELRKDGVKVGVDISMRKIGDQVSSAEKRFIPLVLPFGRDEINSNNFTVKRLSDRIEKTVERPDLVGTIKELLGN